jgi:putative oxygen-independent coproporphyrinogen III oxidase
MMMGEPPRSTLGLATPPLALYLHLPWCRRKCPYCDFNSHVSESVPKERYVAALLAELAREAPRVAGRSVVSVFLGGGTPSLFAPDSIASLLSGVRNRIELAADAEITLEANPGTLECGRFAGYRAAGITRVSLGAQSFAARQLKLLGRIHGPDDTRRAASELRAAGFSNFNLDLMHGLPEQTAAQALEDVRQALALHPPHLSHYQLTIEPGTAFFQRPPRLPDEEVAAESEATAHAELRRAGFERYEVSAWARPGARCRHNLNYWQFGDYLGLGAGAHGKITDVGRQCIWRTEKPRQPERYLREVEAGGALGTVVPVEPRELPFEFMLNALRLADGFCIEQFESRTGVSFASVEPIVSGQARRGLLAVVGSSITPTAFGWRFLNDVQLEYLTGAGSGPEISLSRGRNIGLQTARGAGDGGGVLHNRAGAAEN